MKTVRKMEIHRRRQRQKPTISRYAICRQLIFFQLYLTSHVICKLSRTDSMVKWLLWMLRTVILQNSVAKHDCNYAKTRSSRIEHVLMAEYKRLAVNIAIIGYYCFLGTRIYFVQYSYDVKWGYV